MFSPEEGEFAFGVTWQQVVRHVVISVTATFLAWWALKKYWKK
ncbi:MAG TPA: hypothetical protein VLE48_10015 [Terriglobales bacterium]|nr:hypothetical protein [Terriglobales bacterium]